MSRKYMMDFNEERRQVTRIARDYYNSVDADNFYARVWGGEDIHIGLYERGSETDIKTASRRTVEHICNRLNLSENSIILDIGAGYGGAARFLASKSPIRVIALNLSEKENERNRSLNRKFGLEHRIRVVDGSFEDIPLGNKSIDVVWSQDAILHSGNRNLVLEEVARVLKPGGEFVFTDPMRADGVLPEKLGAILERIHLRDLGSPGFYKKTLRDLGFVDIRFEERRGDLVNHYSRVLEQTEQRFDEIKEYISEDYLKRMREGLVHWIDGGRNKTLTWGIFHAKKSG